MFLLPKLHHMFMPKQSLAGKCAMTDFDGLGPYSRGWASFPLEHTAMYEGDGKPDQQSFYKQVERTVRVWLL